ncbi:MAG: peptidyl-prolyl cis-trans isomerase [Candidatus Cloacimonetes bacterium]|nr:peptidyl-prolyl cis-trans isomerase [Candidatus Cloacimonadota bacterium]
MQNEQNLHKQIFGLKILVGLLIVFEFGFRIGLPLLSWGKSDLSDKDRDLIIKEIQKDLPNMVVHTIGNQIQELVMDKIELNRRVNESVTEAQNLVVMKVGNVSINEEQFRQRLELISVQPGFENMPREDRKKRLVQELSRHYAVVQDATDKGMDKESSFLMEIEKASNRIFLAELIRNGVETPTQADVKAYYEENLNLFTSGDVFSFRMIRSQNQDELLKITSLKDFEESELEIQVVEAASETTTPLHFARSLRTIPLNSLSPILRDENWFYILHKLKETQKNVVPLEQVAQTILNQLAFQRVRDFLDKSANPLRFQSTINKSSNPWKIDGEVITGLSLSSSREILPQFFFTYLEQSREDIREFELDLELLIRKFKQNPLFFGTAVSNSVNQKFESLKEVLLTQNMQKHLEKQVSEPSEADLLAFYNANPSRFVQPAGELVQHIFLTDRTEAAEVLNLALMDTSHFPQLAKSRSKESRTSIHGGDMRYLNSEDLSPQMHQAVSNLKEGEVYPELIPSAKGDGWHILRFVSKVSSTQPAFNEIKTRLRDWVLQDRKNRELSHYVETVQQRYPVVLNEKRINSL